MSEQVVSLDKSSKPRPQGRNVAILVGMRTRVRFRIPPPNLVSKEIKNTLSTLNTRTWGFLCVTVSGLILLLLQPNAMVAVIKY